MDPIPDFSQRRSFPGTDGNSFDVLLHRLDALERLPLPVFAGGLLLIALAATAHFWRSEGWWTTLALWLFFLSDWTLLAMLRRHGKSYGPARAPALLLAIPRALFALLPIPFAGAVQVVGTLLVVYGFWIEPHHIRVTRQALKSSKLAPGKPPIRVLHLGDLHIERITGRERALNRLVKDLQPDLILFSGDILNLSYLDDPLAWDAARQVMSAWRAPGGAYAVTGSPAVDHPDTFDRIIEGLPIRRIAAGCQAVEINGQKINIVGLTCSHKPFIDAPALQTLLDPPPAGFTILLYHSPDLAPNAAQTGAVDLQLSGHTHGGQVRLPVIGALFSGSLYGKRFEAGRYALGPMTLYVTRGIGMEGMGAPRVRFLCSPEIVLWEISGDPSTIRQA